MFENKLKNAKDDVTKGDLTAMLSSSKETRFEFCAVAPGACAHC